MWISMQATAGYSHPLMIPISLEMSFAYTGIFVAVVTQTHVVRVNRGLLGIEDHAKLIGYDRNRTRHAWPKARTVGK
jgi:hypothetical protein